MSDQSSTSPRSISREIRLVVRRACQVWHMVLRRDRLALSGAAVLMALAGLGLSFGGGWWVVSERMPRRAVGVAGLVAGIGVLVGAVVGAGDGSGQMALRAVVVVVLYAVAVVAARAQ